MKAHVRVLISVLALVVAGALTAPAAAAQSPATQHPSAAVVAAPAVARAVVSVTPARIADSRDGLQIPGAVPALGTVAVQVAARGGVGVGRRAGRPTGQRDAAHRAGAGAGVRAQRRHRDRR
jgi:hypothetical protein